MTEPVTLVVSQTGAVVGYACGACGSPSLGAHWPLEHHLERCERCCEPEVCAECGGTGTRLSPVRELSVDGVILRYCLECRYKLMAQRRAVAEADRFQAARKITMSDWLESDLFKVAPYLFDPSQEVGGEGGFVSYDDLVEHARTTDEISSSFYAAHPIRLRVDLAEAVRDAAESGDFHDGILELVPSQEALEPVQQLLDELLEQAVSYGMDDDLVVLVDTPWLERVREG